MLYTLAILPIFASIAATQETVHGAVIFSRHGARTWKSDPPTRLLNYGQNQLYQSGQYWRERYLNATSAHQISGINEDVYTAKQLYASSPDQPVLVTSGQAFLQGLYPPNSSITEKLTDGKNVEAPLSGFQYAQLHTVSDDSSESLWLKGDDSCPAYENAAGRSLKNSSYKDLQKSTKDFYMKFYDSIFAGVVPESQVNYNNAYSLFDYINVGLPYNETIDKAVSSSDLKQLRILADSHEFSQSGAVDMSDSFNPLAVSGRTLSRKIMNQMDTVISSAGQKHKISLLMGSYDTFLAFFGLSGLSAISDDFTGLPNYAATMAFELISFGVSTEVFPNEKDLFVRFLFRNGTESGGAIEYPLFGTGREGAVLPWYKFQEKMNEISIKSTAEWCSFCNSDAQFCQVFNTNVAAASTAGHHWTGPLSPAVAGGVGALSALSFFGLALIGAAMFGIRLRKSPAVPAKEYAESV